jgi:electron-transferring-flavoprotein dehydrogenase
VSREILEFDVVVVGAGPSGLSAACRLAQLARVGGREVSVCVVEKGSSVGAHIISGAVFEPRALAELFPDYEARGAPVGTAVAADRFLWLLGPRASFDVPHALVPRSLRNRGNRVLSLGKLCKWLGEQAEALGCSVLPGFAAVDVIVEDGRVRGVITGDLGVARDGTHKPNYQAGYELRAKYVVFAEGARGSLGRKLEAQFGLRENADPQHFGLGLKEIWHIDPAKHRPGDVVHTVGWPLDASTDGGGFLYHASDNMVYLGLIVGLSYTNPYLDVHDELQRWKEHPRIREVLAGGERVQYGARAVNKGGLQSLPALTMPGGVLVGCEAGFLNPAKIKGTHTAIKSGMLAAESIHAALACASQTEADAEVARYADRVRESWLWNELHEARNFAPGVAKLGPIVGGALAFVEQNLLGGRMPYTLRNRTPDHALLRRAADARKIPYPKPDGVVSFDRMSSVFLASTAHDENQPVHLVLADPAVPVRDNLPRYDEPAQRYCPAGVYEVIAGAAGEPQLRINAANCVHCKTCDIKDPAKNITWVPPEGGSGPNYSGM